MSSRAAARASGLGPRASEFEIASSDRESRGAEHRTQDPGPRTDDPALTAHGLAKRYADPYVAGAALGLVLLASFVIVGRGLGASGAFATAAAGVVAVAAPWHAASNPYFARYLGGDGPWLDWLLFEIVGVFIGGYLSARLAGRLRTEVERGPRMSRNGRLTTAFAGGAVMGSGAVLARGCTSGLALTGGALLSAGSWVFMISAFVAAYLFAPLLKRAWR